MRADHLSLYGYPRRTTPVIEAFMEEHGGIVFDKTSAVAPSCHPSHTTILSQLVNWYSTSVTERFKKKATLAEAELEGEAE